MESSSYSIWIRHCFKVIKKFPGLKIEVLSVGKHKNSPSLNEDGWIVTKNTFAVIDGSAPRINLKFEGKSSARFATDVVRNVLLTTSSSLSGKELVAEITKELNKEIDRVGLRDTIQRAKEACPAALFTAVRIVEDKIIITALGDVSCRLNGKVIHTCYFKTEELMVEKRIKAMKKAKEKDPSISDENLLAVGKEIIQEDLREQVKKYFNNPNSELGLGIINGESVPDKFIKTYVFDLKEVKTLELFSDGYFILPDNAEIESWEEAFFKGEKIDPLRWSKYPAVKGATKDMFSDDRTVLIVRVSVGEK